VHAALASSILAGVVMSASVAFHRAYRLRMGSGVRHPNPS
jgi:hypothetical protein